MLQYCSRPARIHLKYLEIFTYVTGKYFSLDSCIDITLTFQTQTLISELELIKSNVKSR